MSEAWLYRAEWVLPVTTPPIREGAVLVDDEGRIGAVGPATALGDLVPPERTRDLGAAALLPGLVNVHAHPELAMFRGGLEDLPFREWILRLVGAKRAVLGAEEHAVAARWTVVEALRAGITTLAATEMSGAAAGALTEGGMRGVVYQEVFGPDPAQVAESMASLELALEELDRERGERVRLGISPHAPYTVSDALYRAVADRAAREALPVAVHIAESAAERALVTRGEGDFAPGLRARGIETLARARSPIALLEAVGILELAPLLIHCVDLDAADIEAIRRADAPVAHCPVANARLGHGVAPILELRAAGVRVGLGTDSVGSNNRLDLLEEARVASLLQRAATRSPDALPGADLLRLCTLDGARALGLDHRIGSLEPGKEADLCAVSLVAPHTVPVYDPVTTLFHSARGTDVILTLVSGETLFDGTTIRTLDEAALAGAMRRIGRRLAEHLG